MEEKINAVIASNESAEKDAALLECIRNISELLDRRIPQLEKKGGNICNNVKFSTYRLNNDDSLIRLCTNKRLLPQIVEQEKKISSETPVHGAPVKPRTLADHVQLSIQSGLRIIEEKQLCVEVHSEYADETLKVFEDVNPYLMRDLPPLIGSSTFETGKFINHQSPSAVSPVDDVVIQLPQPVFSQPILANHPIIPVSPVADLPPVSIILPPPASHPILPSPSLSSHSQNNDVNSKSAKKASIVTPKTLTPSSSNSDDKFEEEYDDKKVKDGEKTAVENSLLNPLEDSQANTKPMKIQAPPNLAEIIRNSTVIKKDSPELRKNNASLFDEEDEDDGSQRISVAPSKPAAVPNNTPLVNGTPLKSHIEEVKPTSQVTQIPPSAPPRKAVTVIAEKSSPVVTPVQTKGLKSLFSSSDEEEDMPIKQTKVQPKTATRNHMLSKPIAPKRAPEVPDEVISSTVATNSLFTENSIAAHPTTTQNHIINKTKTKSLFDDSDEDDGGFFVAKSTQKKASIDKTAPKPQPTQRSVPSKTARKSMFSSSESD